MFPEIENRRSCVSDVVLNAALDVVNESQANLPLEFYSSLAAMSEASGLPSVAMIWRQEITCHIDSDPTDLEALFYWEFSYSDPRDAFRQIYGHYENDLGQIPIDFLPRLMRLARIADPLKMHELSGLPGSESYDFPGGEVAAFECHIRAGDYYKAKESFYNLHDARSEMEEGGYSYAKRHSSVFAYEDVQGALDQMALSLCLECPNSVISDSQSPFYDPYPDKGLLRTISDFANYRDAAISLMDHAAKSRNYDLLQRLLNDLNSRIDDEPECAFRTRAMIYRVLGEVQDEDLQTKLVEKYNGEKFFREFSSVDDYTAIGAIEEIYQRGIIPRQGLSIRDASAVGYTVATEETEVLSPEFVLGRGFEARFKILALSDEEIATALNEFWFELAFTTLYKNNPGAFEAEIEVLGEGLLAQENRKLSDIVPLWAEFIREIGSECSVLPDVVDKLYTNFACAAARRSAETDDPQVLAYVLNHLELTGDQKIDAITQAARIIANKTK